MIVAITQDTFVLRGLARIGEVIGVKSLTLVPPMDVPPVAVVIDLDVKGTLLVAGQVKAQWANSFVAGFLSYPNRKLWDEAEASGFDLVTTRGALAAQLQTRLQDWRGEARPRVRICDAADLAGRLGVVARLDDLPIGPVAVYHIGGQVYAVGDVCPHAGARLSEGELAGTVVTCPRHGSQFDVCTGERLRGPADVPIETYRVEVDGGQVFLVTKG